VNIIQFDDDEEEKEMARVDSKIDNYKSDDEHA